MSEFSRPNNCPVGNIFQVMIFRLFNEDNMSLACKQFEANNNQQELIERIIGAIIMVLQTDLPLTSTVHQQLNTCLITLPQQLKASMFKGSTKCQQVIEDIQLKTVRTYLDIHKLFSQ